MTTSSVLFGHGSQFSIAFYLGSMPIYWYGILTAIGYLSAIIIFVVVCSKRYKVDYDVPIYYVFFALPMILFGARLFSVIIGDTKLNSFVDFFNFKTGGLAVQGGVIFGIITAFIYFPLILKSPKKHIRVVENGNVYIRRPSMWIYADAIIPTILIGQAIGRWGNFFNGEIFGQAVEPAKLLWLQQLMPGVYEHMTPATGIIVNGVTNGQMYFQPLFLYESFLNIVTFIIIYCILAEIKWFKAGTISSLYFLSYGVIRFITESQRDSAFTFVTTYIINSLFLVWGILSFIYLQFFSIKLRKYKVFLYFSDYFNYLFKKNTKPNISNKKYDRIESNILYFANR